MFTDTAGPSIFNDQNARACSGIAVLVVPLMSEHNRRTM